jgi:hypothetical protein
VVQSSLTSAAFQFASPLNLTSWTAHGFALSASAVVTASSPMDVTLSANAGSPAKVSV